MTAEALTTAHQALTVGGPKLAPVRERRLHRKCIIWGVFA
jgi:hypothetical protein